MISLHEAQQIIRSFMSQATETVSLSNALGRTVADSIVSPAALPSFNKSAVDGYACKRNDLPNALMCVATVFAGSDFDDVVKDGQCVKIMTGARVPAGADCVFMYEEASVDELGRVKCLDPHTKDNICCQGEDVRQGQVVIDGGTALKPHHLAILAAVGVVNVDVFKLLKVGIVATGTELVEAGDAALPFQTRNSNSPLFMSILPNAIYYGIVRDEQDAIERLLSKALSECDVLLVTGGASDSEFDLVPIVIKQLGFKIEIQKVAIQPGKPFMFAHNQSNKFCFGLSGNPVSSYVQFILMVHDFLRLPKGIDLNMPLAEPFIRKNGQRDLFVPVRIDGGKARAVPYNGSAHIAAFAQAHGIMHVAKGVLELNMGDWVDVRQI